MSQLDHNGDGRVSYDEWLAATLDWSQSQNSQLWGSWVRQVRWQALGGTGAETCAALHDGCYQEAEKRVMHALFAGPGCSTARLMGCLCVLAGQSINHSRECVSTRSNVWWQASICWWCCQLGSILIATTHTPSLETWGYMVKAPPLARLVVMLSFLLPSLTVVYTCPSLQ